MNLTDGVNLKSLVFAGFTAGYVMYIVDLALEGFLGLFGSYKIYKQWLIDERLFEGIEDVALFIGHQLNSILFAFFFAYPLVYKKLPENLILKGFVFATLWHVLVLAVSFMTGFLGSKWMYEIINMNFTSHITLYLLHVVWGMTLSIFYKPLEEVE